MVQWKDTTQGVLRKKSKKNEWIIIKPFLLWVDYHKTFSPTTKIYIRLILVLAVIKGWYLHWFDVLMSSYMELSSSHPKKEKTKVCKLLKTYMDLNKLNGNSIQNFQLSLSKNLYNQMLIIVYLFEWIVRFLI